MIQHKTTVIKIDDNRKLWFVSDTHFFHHKLCKGYPDHFENHRLYETVEEMNSDIVDRWNKTVAPDDQVIMLGDWFMNVPHAQLGNYLKEFMGKLNGEFVAICLGNHDYSLEKKSPDTVFYKRIVFDYRGRHFVAQHHDFKEIPYDDADLAKEKNVLVHGHTHSEFPLSQLENGMHQNNVCWEARYDLVEATQLCSTNEEYINIELPESDLAEITKKAMAVGMTPGEYIKDVLEDFVLRAKEEDWQRVTENLIKGKVSNE